MLGKNRAKQVFFGYEVRVNAIIGNSLVHRVPKQQTLKIIKRELVRLQNYANLSLSETNHLWLDSYNRYMRVSKKSFSLLRKANFAEKGTKDYEEELKNRKNIVYKSLRSEWKLLEREKNELANEYEYRFKHDSLFEQFQSGVFYLCSTHINPAKDHVDWEGKVYVNAGWKDRVDPDMHGKIAAYIRNHDIKTVQWVVGEPVYLVTRPNCKHYFIEISVEEVLGNSVRKLLKKHNMYMENEPEQSYAYGQYKNYYERLKALTYLHHMFDAEELSVDITNTRKLARKWKVEVDRANNK